MPQKSLAEVIRKHRERLGLKQEELGDMVGVTRQMISRYERGTDIPRAEKYERITRILKIQEHSFLDNDEDDEDAIRVPETESFHLEVREPVVSYVREARENDHDTPRSVHAIDLDLYEAIPAGGLSDVSPEQIGKWPVLHSMANENYKVIRVYGESMAYRIRDRDLVLINTDIHKPQNGNVVSAIYKGETTLKRYQRINGKIILLADNPDFVPRVIEIENPEDLYINGVVEAIVYRKID